MKNIIVTGAGRGIGFQTALALLANKENRVVCISRNRTDLGKLQNEKQDMKLQGTMLIYPMDITDYQPDDLMQFLSAHKIGSLEGLVNNAGLLVNKPFEKLTSEDFKNMYEVNLFGPAKLILNLMPLLRQAMSPHIVNISSLGGFQGSSKFKGLSAYSSSKAALACLSECLAEEFHAFHIAVNALALGAVDTEMLQQAFPGFKAPVTARDMGCFIADFTLNGHKIFNGKVLPVALSSQ